MALSLAPMRTALFLVVIVGALIGVLIPHGSTPPAVSAAPSTPSLPRETVIERSERGHFAAVAEVNGMPVRFIVDTGADIVALSEEDAMRAHVPFDRARYEVVGRGAAGPVRGARVTIDAIDLDGKRATGVAAVVLEGASMSLLGHSYLRELRSVSIEGDRMVLR